MKRLLLLSVPLVAVFAFDMEWATVARAVGVGFAGGMAGGMVAGAIGLISVPLLVVFLGMPIHMAQATNLFQSVFTAGAAALRHRRFGNVDLRLAAPLMLGSLLGAPLGAWTSLLLPARTLQWGFFLILTVMAVRMAYRLGRGPVEKPEGPHRVAWAPPELLRTELLGWIVAPIEGEHRGQSYRVPRIAPFLVGAGVGFVSALLGVGGGFLLTPITGAVLGIPTHLAVGTSLTAIASNSLFGTIPHALHGSVPWLIGALVATGGAVGAWIGSHWGNKLPERTIQGLFILVLVVVAARMAPF